MEKIRLVTEADKRFTLSLVIYKSIYHFGEIRYILVADGRKISYDKYVYYSYVHNIKEKSSKL